MLDGHASRIDIQPDQQVGNADRMVELELFAVQGNVQGNVVRLRRAAFVVPGCRGTVGCEADQRWQRTAVKPGKSR